MLKTVRDACELHEMVWSYSITDQIENLRDLIQNESDGREFFAKNYVTNGMDELFREGLKRLSGQSDQAVFELAQAMGGGKTHLMIALGLLAKNRETRKEVLPELAARFGDFSSRVVAFTGRLNPDHYFWGEIAEQLGHDEMFKKFHVGGAKAPDLLDWKNLIGDEPTLILLDELPPYFDNAATIPVGQKSLANVATYALSSLLAAAMELPRVCIVISNLTSSYPGASRQLSSIIRDIRDETRRQARIITPVQLAGHEIYGILKKRLFTRLPRDEEIDEVADRYAELLTEAQAASYVAPSSVEQFADEVRATYPFHPSIKHLIALFKDNESFRQTRGLMQFTTRLLQSVWKRATSDVYLVGVQHLDINSESVRDEILRINNEMAGAVTRDIADKGNAHAEEIDGELNSDAGTQVANMLLLSSLSRAVNAVAGLTKEETLEYLISPNRKPEEFAKAFEALRKNAWYLHREEGDVYCFKDTENLTKRIEKEAERAPAPRIEKALREGLQGLFQPELRNAYQECIALPKLEDLKPTGTRTLLIVNPDNRVPPEAIARLYEGIIEKNNLLIVSGHDSHLTTRVDEAMRQLWAATKIEKEIPASNPVHEEVVDRISESETSFLQAVSGAFNYLFYPTRTGLSHLKMTFKFGSKENSVESQIEQALASKSCWEKLASDLEERPDKYIIMAELRLWTSTERRIPWRDVVRRSVTEAGWPWMPGAKGMERLRQIALEQGRWRMGADGYVEKGPFPKEKTSVNVLLKHYDDRTGEATLELQTKNAGQNAQIRYNRSREVCDRDPVADSHDNFHTFEPHLYFLAVDPDGDYETGEPYLWKNKLTVRHQPRDTGDGRMVELAVVPEAELRYTLDGSNPKQGAIYREPFSVPNTALTLLVHAHAGQVEVEEKFQIPVRGDDTFRIDDIKPAELLGRARPQLDTTAKVFDFIKEFRNDVQTVFHGVRITVGEGETSVSVTFGPVRDISANLVESVIRLIRESIRDDQAEVQIIIRGNSSFSTGDALKRFANICGIKLDRDVVVQ